MCTHVAVVKLYLLNLAAVNLFFQLYGLWKDPEGLRIITGTSGTAFKSTGEENKETINQLSQEVQRLKQELRRVSVSALL